MTSADDWVYEHTRICAGDPAVSGQLLPHPQMRAFIERIQADALRHAANIARRTRHFDAACQLDTQASQLEYRQKDGLCSPEQCQNLIDTGRAKPKR